jgi:hypothetical protein
MTIQPQAARLLFIIPGPAWASWQPVPRVLILGTYRDSELSRCTLRPQSERGDQ